MKNKLSILIIGALLIPALAFARQTVRDGWQSTEFDTNRSMVIADKLVKMWGELAARHVNPKAAVTVETGDKICKAVAKKAKWYDDEFEIYKIRIVSRKNRLPENAVQHRKEDQYLGMIERGAVHKGELIGADLDKIKHYLYLKPIYAGERCLSCHGKKKKRPDFVKAKYPTDKSFDFEAGDLMGAVAVYTLKWK